MRGLDGIDAEWVCEEEDIKSEPVQKTYCGRKITAEESNVLRMEKLETVLVRVHHLTSCHLEANLRLNVKPSFMFTEVISSFQSDYSPLTICD